jgi:lysophospholipase L1-like esterase
MRPARLLKKLGISLASLVVLGLAAEAVARLAEPGPFSLYDSNPFEPDAELDYVQIPGFRGRWEDTWYEINSAGYRGPELPPPDAGGLFRVVALGDSCTAGKGVLEEETWPRRLETLLAEELPDGLEPAVANLGVVGYSGTQYLGTLERTGLALRPDVVVVGYNLNDFPNSIEAVDQRVYHERKLRSLIPAWLRDGLSRTALYRYARAFYYELQKDADMETVNEIAGDMAENVQDPEVLARERGYLEGIVEDSRAVGAHVLVLLFPYESQVLVDAYDDAPVEGLRGICAELDVPFVDLAPVLRAAAREGGETRSLYITGDRYHPNAEGYEVVARTVRDALRGAGWLPVAH